MDYENLQRRILIAEDDATSLALLEGLLGNWGYDLRIARSGTDAWDQLLRPDAPRLVVLEWLLPEMDGLEVCRRAGELGGVAPHLILVTARDQPEDLERGLQAGASDFLPKPFDHRELRARLEVGKRVIGLRCALVKQVEELQSALDHVQTLQGILPICMHCGRIRDDRDAWLKLDEYLARHTDAKLSHGLCEPCLEEHYPE